MSLWPILLWQLKLTVYKKKMIETNGSKLNISSQSLITALQWDIIFNILM